MCNKIFQLYVLVCITTKMDNTYVYVELRLRKVYKFTRKSNFLTFRRRDESSIFLDLSFL